MRSPTESTPADAQRFEISSHVASSPEQDALMPREKPEAVSNRCWN